MSRRNTALSALRILLSFAVVQYRLELNGSGIAVTVLRGVGSIAVPCFMFISFYLTADHIDTPNRQWLGRRLLRLYIPIFFWNIIHFIVVNCLRLKYAMGTVPISELVYGLVTGLNLRLSGQLWFLTAQLLCLLIVLAARTLCKHRFTLALYGLLIIPIMLEYSGINHALLSKLPLYIGYQLGRTVECLPYAVCGILWAQKKASLKNSAPTLLGLIVLCAALSIFDPAPAGFDYSGCQRIAVAVCLCVLITKVPPLACDALSRMIDHLGDCTLGIYCLHVLVFNVLDIIRPHGLMRGTPVYALIVFIISLILTFPLRRVTRKCLPLKYVV